MLTTHALCSVSIVAEVSDCKLPLHLAWWRIHACAACATKLRSEAHRLQSGTGACSAAARSHQGNCRIHRIAKSCYRVVCACVGGCV